MSTVAAVPALRNEWLKMSYPGEGDGIVVCQILQVPGKNVWVAFHATKPSQRSQRFNSPGGVDEGTIRYLDGLGVIHKFNLHYKNFGKIHKVDFALLVGAERSGMWTHNVTTRKGQFRRRVFLPDQYWTVVTAPEPYVPPVTIQYHDETRITPSGEVMWRTTA